MHHGRLLVTGSSGLIGRAVVKELRAAGADAVGVDLREQGAHRVDIADTARLEQHLAGVSGVIHLAAVARVTSAEQYPERCRAVNIQATGRLLAAARRARGTPWVLFASSREVYGEQDTLPVKEDAPLRPKNVYAKSKLDGEILVEAARQDGLQTAIVRFSNVYGSIDDYSDRVIPAFAAAAVRGGTMRIDGGDCELDFTHVDDVAEGVMRLVELLAGGERKLPAVHLASGQGTTLIALARLANEINGGRARIVEGAVRSVGVRSFVGDPERARALLGWSASSDLHAGIAKLSHEFVASGIGEESLQIRVSAAPA
jgi:nucleoside-diphosphate-sugar epimerase